MLTLLIETSTEKGLVAISRHSEILFHKELPQGFNNSKYLLPTIIEGLQNTQLSLKQLTMVAVGIGPGSYTGMRVGVIVAKSLAYACRLPLVGVSSLEGFIPHCLLEGSSYVAVIDAKIGGVYLQTGTRFGNQIHYTSAPLLCTLEEFSKHVNNNSNFVTPCSTRLQPLLQALYPNNHWQWEEAWPDPTQLTLSAIDKYNKGLASTSTQLDLLYLRKTQAEIEREIH